MRDALRQGGMSEVVLLGPWITQTKNFAGNGATTGYLPARKLTVSVSTTCTPEAFDASGAYENASSSIFTEITSALAPNPQAAGCISRFAVAVSPSAHGGKRGPGAEQGFW